MTEAQRVFKDTGRPFRPMNLILAMKKIKRRIEGHDLPGAILIVAPPGKGKTTLMVHLGAEYQGEPMNYDYQLGNGFEDFQKKLQICRVRNLPLVAYDEGGDIDKRRFMSDTNYKIRRILQLARGFQKIIIMAIHDFSLFDEAVLNLEVIRWMVYIPVRGGTRADIKVYSLDRMHRLLATMQALRKKKTHPSVAYKIITPNFVGNFYNLPKEEADRLRKFSLAAKDDLLDDLSGEERGLYSQKALMKNLGKSQAWVIRRLKHYGMASSFKKGRQVFYTEDVLQKLAEDPDPPSWARRRMDKKAAKKSDNYDTGFRDL